MKRASLCIYCGKSIEHPDDPAQVQAIHEIFIKHDRECPSNPIAIENQVLKRALISTFKEGFIAGATSTFGHEMAWKVSVSKRLLDEMEKKTK